jgi:hypothetical protein
VRPRFARSVNKDVHNLSEDGDYDENICDINDNINKKFTKLGNIEDSMKKLNDIMDVSTKSTLKNKYDFELGSTSGGNGDAIGSVFDSYYNNMSSKLQNIQNNVDPVNNKYNVNAVPREESRLPSQRSEALFYETGAGDSDKFPISQYAGEKIFDTFVDDFLNQKFNDFNFYNKSKNSDNFVKTNNTNNYNEISHFGNFEQTGTNDRENKKNEINYKNNPYDNDELSHFGSKQFSNTNYSDDTKTNTKNSKYNPYDNVDFYGNNNAQFEPFKMPETKIHSEAQNFNNKPFVINHQEEQMNNVNTYPLVIPQSKPKPIEKSIDINRKIINIDQLHAPRKIEHKEQKNEQQDDEDIKKLNYLKDIINRTKADIESLDLGMGGEINGNKPIAKPNESFQNSRTYSQYNYDDDDINPRKLPNLISKNNNL